MSTARAVLCVLSFITESGRGVSAREVALHLDKSLSTAYHLLASLEAEGFIVRTGRAGCYELVDDKPAPPVRAAVPLDVHRALRAQMQQVFAMTGRRTCIGLLGDDGVHLVEDMGRQGLPRMGNLETPRIRGTAHALAVGKVLLARLDEVALRRWEREFGMQSFTASTIVDRTVLRRELADVRDRGIAFDDGEYDSDFGSLAVPVLDRAGRPVAVIGTTVTRHQYAIEKEMLELALRGVRPLEEAPVG